MNGNPTKGRTSYRAVTALCYLVFWLFFSPLSEAGAIRAVPVDVVPYAMSGLDVNDDGKVDLIVGGLDQDAICAVAVSGDQLWRRPTDGMPLALEAGDIDGDGTSEIVAIIGTSASKILVLDRAGDLIREIRPEVVVYFLRLADVDGDNRPDIVVAGYMGKILVYNHRGRKILDKTVVTKDFLRQMAGLGAGDVDGDGRTDIAYQGSLQLPGLIDAEGKPIQRWVLPSLQGGLAGCADITGTAGRSCCLDVFHRSGRRVSRGNCGRFTWVRNRANWQPSPTA